MGPAASARIGPNAIIQVAAALKERDGGEAAVRRVFEAAGLEPYLRQQPEAMVPEFEVVQLHEALRRDLGIAEARRISRDAGVKTGDYLLAHRIPKPAQAVLKRLPGRLAAPVLLGAIGAHAWTFAGSARFSYKAGKPVQLTFVGSPLCRGAASTEPLCDFYAGTFERLFRVLVDRQSACVETACEALGAPACTFEISW